MKRLRWVLILIAVVVVIAVLRATVFKPPPLEVEVAKVTVGTVEDAVANSQAGTVRARLRARLGAERAGRVVEIPHREGSNVRKGETLLLLDGSSARNQLDLADRDLEAAKATYQSAQAAATLARQDYDRIAKLKQQDVVSQGEFDQAKSRLDGANAERSAVSARLERARAAVRLAQDELNHLRVVAPFDGVVTQRFVELGESVVPGQAVLELMSPTRLYVSAPIDEIDIGRLRTGLAARVTLDPYPGMVWQGTVTRVSEIVNDVKEQNRTLEVEVDFSPDASMPLPKPGTSADIQIALDRHDGVRRVPTFAVIEGKRVLVVQGGKAVSRDVKTGIKNWEWTEIKDGLVEGEPVITNLDKQGLKPGVAVMARAKQAGNAGGPRGRAARTGS
jgi:HlyD family secretion protein